MTAPWFDPSPGQKLAIDREAQQEGVTVPLIPVSTSVNRTALSGELTKANAASGPITVTLPATAGAFTAVQKTDNTANVVTVVCAGTINGDANAQIISQWAGGVFVGDGANCALIARTG